MIENIFKEHDEDFLKFLKEIDNDIKIAENLRKTKTLLVLDLDHTLIYASKVENKNITESIPKDDEDYSIIYQEITCFSGKKRPHLNTFFDYIFEHFDIAVWSAGNEQYVYATINHIFGEKKKLLKFVYTGDQCENKLIDNQIMKIKPLSKIWGYDQSKIIILDDNEYTFTKNPHNALKISCWSGDKTDDKLLRCIEILKILKTCDYIPTIIIENKFNEGF